VCLGVEEYFLYGVRLLKFMPVFVVNGKRFLVSFCLEKEHLGKLFTWLKKVFLIFCDFFWAVKKRK
jgi:hypothetical protein